MPEELPGDRTGAVYSVMLEILPPHLQVRVEHMYPGFIDVVLGIDGSRGTHRLIIGFDADGRQGLWRGVIKIPGESYIKDGYCQEVGEVTLLSDKDDPSFKVAKEILTTLGWYNTTETPTEEMVPLEMAARLFAGAVAGAQLAGKVFRGEVPHITEAESRKLDKQVIELLRDMVKHR